jgi:hypothetical protein
MTSRVIPDAPVSKGSSRKEKLVKQTAFSRNQWRQAIAEDARHLVEEALGNDGGSSCNVSDVDNHSTSSSLLITRGDHERCTTTSIRSRCSTISSASSGGGGAFLRGSSPRTSQTSLAAVSICLFTVLRAFLHILMVSGFGIYLTLPTYSLLAGPCNESMF